MRIRMKKGIRTITALSLAMLSGITMFPREVNAAETATHLQVGDSTSISGQATAVFTIDQETLDRMGYGLIVSIPVDFELRYSVLDEEFKGSGEIFCYGMAPDNTEVSISVDEKNSMFQKIRDEANNVYDLKGTDCYSANLTQNTWNATDLKSNYMHFVNGEDEEISKGRINVEISGAGFLPKVFGKYETQIPLTIKQVRS